MSASPPVALATRSRTASSIGVEHRLAHVLARAAPCCAARRRPCAAGSSRCRTRAGACGCRSCAPRRASARAPIAPVTSGCSMTSPSSTPMRCMRPEMRSLPNRRMRSSSSDSVEARRARIALAARRGRAAGGRCAAIRGARCRGCAARRDRRRPAPSLMSVPRPAMLVAIVTAPRWPACGDDLGLLLVVLGVEHVVLDAAPLEHARQQLAHLDADGADQHRLAAARGTSTISSITALYFSRLVR